MLVSKKFEMGQRGDSVVYTTACAALISPPTKRRLSRTLCPSQFTIRSGHHHQPVRQVAISRGTAGHHNMKAFASKGLPAKSGRNVPASLRPMSEMWIQRELDVAALNAQKNRSIHDSDCHISIFGWMGRVGPVQVLPTRHDMPQFRQTI